MFFELSMAAALIAATVVIQALFMCAGSPLPRSSRIKQASSHFAHDLPHLIVWRVKRRGGTATPPLYCVGDDVTLARIHQVATVGVVVRGARSRVEPDRLLQLVFAPPHSPDSVAIRLPIRAASLASAAKVLPVNIVVYPSPHPIVTRVTEVHPPVVRLVFVGAPVMQDCLTVAVQVDQVSNVRKTIEEPNYVPRLGLGGRSAGPT